jgi:hypothetical protein
MRHRTQLKVGGHLASTLFLHTTFEERQCYAITACSPSRLPSKTRRVKPLMTMITTKSLKPTVLNICKTTHYPFNSAHVECTDNMLGWK